ncbi:MAG: hypothetical protein RLZZ399_1632 [Verrucomicrobiota bacterium]|jgi:NAD(P)H-hydrate epimerase
MRVLSPEQTIEIERKALHEGFSAEALMEEAGRGMSAAVGQFEPRAGVCLAVFGKGHNGGDALVCARLLSEAGWRVILIPAFSAEELAPLTSQKWNEAGRCETLSLAHLESWRPDPALPLVVLDGLLGIGSRGPLRGPISRAAEAMNALRRRSHARVFALDLPTGLDATTGATTAHTVVADVTLTVGFPKSGLVAEGAEHCVGRLAVIPLEAFCERVSGPFSEEVAAPPTLAPLWARRSAGIHKGDCGRVALVAGTRGTMGAAALAAMGALRSGAGLVTLWVAEAVYPLAVSIVPVECMVRPASDLREVLEDRADTLGIGPGLGTGRPQEILDIIRGFRGPAVVDADALNVLAHEPGILSRCSGPRLLTPHPGEMNRIAPDLKGLSRVETATRFAQKWPVTLLLKGARSVVSTEGRPLSWNPTGNAGMASGGMGDVLTGVCASFLAQGLECHDAARLGAWCCGRAAEALIARRSRSEESLLATDVAMALGDAFDALRRRGV